MSKWMATERRVEDALHELGGERTLPEIAARARLSLKRTSWALRGVAAKRTIMVDGRARVCYMLRVRRDVKPATSESERGVVA